MIDVETVDLEARREGQAPGELVMSISAQDRDRISAAIRGVEARTLGEIVCVLARTSSDATALPMLMAALAALALPWLLVALTQMSVHRILLLQIATFLVLAPVLCLPYVRVALMPPAARRRPSHGGAERPGVVRQCDLFMICSHSERFRGHSRLGPY